MSLLASGVGFNGLFNICKNGIAHVKTNIGGIARDVVEGVASIIIPSLIVSECTTNMFPNRFLRGGVALGCGLLSFYLYQRFIIQPLNDREIKGILATSKAHPKSALMIHTKKDHNGAFSSTHAITQMYRNCAKRHSIDQIRGMTYEERIKVQGKKYDVIAVMAHGQPNVIDMDGEFFGFSGNSLKKISFLSCRLKEGGKIILRSCSTGKGDDNIAKAISAGIPHATVYAPSNDIYCGVGEEFDEDMTPKFNDGRFFKGNDTTRVYRNGQLIFS